MLGHDEIYLSDGSGLNGKTRRPIGDFMNQGSIGTLLVKEAVC